RPPPHRSPEPADIRNSAIAPIGTTFSTPVKAVPPGVTVVGATSSVDDVGGTGVGATLALVVVSVAVVMSVTVVVVRSVTVGVVVTVDVASHSCWRTSPGAAVTPLAGAGPTVTWGAAGPPPPPPREAVPWCRGHAARGRRADRDRGRRRRRDGLGHGVGDGGRSRGGPGRRGRAWGLR